MLVIVSFYIDLKKVRFILLFSFIIKTKKSIGSRKKVFMTEQKLKTKVQTSPYSLEEQETVISFDRNSGTWRFYSTVPHHAKKFEEFILPSDTFSSWREVNDEGNLVAIDGVLDTEKVKPLPTIKRVISDERRAKLSEQLARGRKKQGK